MRVKAYIKFNILAFHGLVRGICRIENTDDDAIESKGGMYEVWAAAVWKERECIRAVKRAGRLEKRSALADSE